jgi:hypothetical protein
MWKFWAEQESTLLLSPKFPACPHRLGKREHETDHPNFRKKTV